MNSETADTAARAARPTIVQAAGELADGVERPAALAGSVGDAAGWTARLRADPARMAAVRETWRALWRSRLLVWTAGVGAAAAFGLGSAGGAFDPPRVTRGFGWLGDLLAAPAARWDSTWYLVIAHWGYRPDLAPYTSPRTAYFPLYPLALRALGWLGSPLVLAGVLVSLCAFALALYGIHRLTTLELARAWRLPQASPRVAEVARLAVIVTAFSPMAFFFSAVYTDALYMALSVGLFWCARHGRWMWVGLLGALAGATRSTGLMLAVPALIIYLYGPREDRAPDFAADSSPPPAAPVGGERPRARALAFARALRPRYRPRADLLWLALVPAGVALYCGWLALAGGEALGPFHAEAAWSRHFVGPYLGAWDGVKAGFDGLRQLLSMQSHHIYFRLAGGSPFIAAWHNLMELAFLALAVLAVIGVLRRLPLAYGAYVIAALALPLSYPVAPQPLMSVPRYLVVLFPLGIWLAAWLAERPRVQRPAFVLSAALMVFFVGQFATWHWVA
jgi:hypothetical protein